MLNGKTSWTKNNGNLCNVFLLAFHKAKHTHPMSSYADGFALLKRLGVNVGVRIIPVKGEHGQCRTLRKLVRWFLGAAFWWIGGHHKNRAGDCLHCVCVQQRRVYLGLPWIDWLADRTAQAITDGLMKLFHDASLDDWMTKFAQTELAVAGDSLVHCTHPWELREISCETFNLSVVKLLQFYLQKGGAKKTAVLKKLCEDNGISFLKLGKFHNIVLKTTSNRLQKERLTIGECKDELMVAIGQFTLLLDVRATTGHALFLMLKLTGTRQMYTGG